MKRSVKTDRTPLQQKVKDITDHCNNINPDDLYNVCVERCELFNEGIWICFAHKYNPGKSCSGVSEVPSNWKLLKSNVDILNTGGE